MARLLFSGSQILILIIQLYRQVISPLLGPHCRFNPTCSLYGIEVLCKFNILQGSWLIIKRVLKCHYLHPGGYDPVPPETFDTREY